MKKKLAFLLIGALTILYTISAIPAQQPSLYHLKFMAKNDHVEHRFFKNKKMAMQKLQWYLRNHHLNLKKIILELHDKNKAKVYAEEKRLLRH